MRHSLPGHHRLLLTWMMLMLLTAISMLSAQVVGEGRLQPLAWWSALVIGLVTFYKARQVVMIYLNLSASTTTWKLTLNALLLTSLALIAVGYVLANYFL